MKVMPCITSNCLGSSVCEQGIADVHACTLSKQLIQGTNSKAHIEVCKILGDEENESEENGFLRNYKMEQYLSLKYKLSDLKKEFRRLQSPKTTHDIDPNEKQNIPSNQKMLMVLSEAARERDMLPGKECCTPFDAMLVLPEPTDCISYDWKDIQNQGFLVIGDQKNEAPNTNQIQYFEDDSISQTKEIPCLTTMPMPPGKQDVALHIENLQHQLEVRCREINRLNNTIADLEGKLIDQTFSKVIKEEMLHLQNRNEELENRLQAMSSAKVRPTKTRQQPSSTKLEDGTENKPLIKDSKHHVHQIGKPTASKTVRKEGIPEAMRSWRMRKRMELQIAKLEEKLKKSEASEAEAQKESKMLQGEVARLRHKIESDDSRYKELKKLLIRIDDNSDADGLVPASALLSMIEELHDLQKKHDILERLHLQHINDRNDVLFASDNRLNATSDTNSVQEDKVFTPNRTEAISLDSESVDTASEKGKDIKSIILEREQALRHVRTLQARLQMVTNEFRDYPRRNPRKSKDAMQENPTDSASRHKSNFPKEKRPFEIKKRPKQSSTEEEAVPSNDDSSNSAVSFSQYMRAVRKARASLQKIKALEDQLKDYYDTKQRNKEYQSEISKLQSILASLRQQLWQYKHQDGSVSENQAAVLHAQIDQLEQSLRDKDAQIQYLQSRECEDARILTEEGLPPRALVAQLMASRCALTEMEERERQLYRLLQDERHKREYESHIVLPMDTFR